MYMLKLYRLEIQAKVRHLGRNPGTTAQQSIESARKQLTALVHELKRKTLAAGVVEVHSSTRTVQEPLGMWDEVVNEPMPGGPAQGDLNPAIDEPASTGAMPIENQMLPLPSNGNVGQEEDFTLPPLFRSDSAGLRRTPPESGEFGGTQIRRETALPKYFSHAFQHQITPEYQRNITVLPPDSHRNLMKTSVQHRTPPDSGEFGGTQIGRETVLSKYVSHAF